MIEFHKAIIIDDEIEIIDIVESVLDELGFKAIFKIQKSSELFNVYKDDVNLLVLDLFMPDVDGVEILRYLGEVKSKSHIILISGHSKQVLASAERVASAYGLNILGSITKPFSIQSIIGLIANYNTNFIKKVPSIALREIKFSIDFFKQCFKEKYFILYYQPQVDLKKKDVLGFEALVRILHPEFGLLFPDQFLAEIERYNLITEMTQYVIEEAMAFFGSLKKKGYEKRVSINISTLNLIDTSLPEQILTLVKQNDLNPDNIVIELIETGHIGTNAKCLEILTRLAMKGLRLSIDDFGTGYASLEQLGNAPFRELKIDKSFVFKLISNPESKAIIDSVVKLAHKLDLEVVAEGIENKEIGKILNEIGVDIGQGYHYSMPIPAKAVLQFLKNFIYD